MTSAFSGVEVEPAADEMPEQVPQAAALSPPEEAPDTTAEEVEAAAADTKEGARAAPVVETMTSRSRE